MDERKAFEALSPAYIGVAVRMARARASLKQEQLAELVERTQGYISNIEKGGKRPGLELLERIAYYTGYEISELLALAELARDDEKGEG